MAFLLSLSNHLSRKRPVDTFLDFVTNSSSIVIVFLNELAAALNASPNASAQDAVATYLELKPDSSLANVLDSKHQEKKLNLVANDILELPHNVLTIILCHVLHDLVVHQDIIKGFIIDVASELDIGCISRVLMPLYCFNDADLD